MVKIETKIKHNKIPLYPSLRSNMYITIPLKGLTYDARSVTAGYKTKNSCKMNFILK